MLRLFKTRVNHVANHDKLVKDFMASMNGYNQMHDTEINVKGVEPERQQAAVDEIRWFLKILSTATRESRGDVTLRRVVIAKDFNATISELSPQWETSEVKYKAQRRTVRTIGKIIEHVENDKISFSLVFDGEVFGKWDEQAKASRFEKFLHEMVHIVIDATRFQKLGTGNYYPNEKTAEGVCLSLALVATNEYRVDRIVEELCQKFLSDDNHQPVPLAKLYLAEGFDLRFTLLELMSKMPEFIVQNVLDFKEWRIAIDELWYRICQFLDELLTVFAHCAAMYDQQEEWLQTLADISQTQAYRSFLGGHIEAIHKEWQRFKSTDSTQCWG
ncbi:hypothetical protein ES703_79192 [subsurface metagenome]